MPQERSTARKPIPEAGLPIRPRRPSTPEDHWAGEDDDWLADGGLAGGVEEWLDHRFSQRGRAAPIRGFSLWALLVAASAIWWVQLALLVVWLVSRG